MELTTLNNNNEIEKLPKLNGNQNQQHNNPTCLVTYIQSGDNKNLESSRRDVQRLNTCLPDDLLIALKQTEIPREYLGPKQAKQVLQSSKPPVPPILRKPDNVWNHDKQREKFKFLTEQPVCSCGAGKDISFLYDSITQQKPTAKTPPSKYDMSSIRATEDIVERPIQIPDTLVPDEYHIVQNRGVWPLKVNENKFTTIPEDHLNHVTVFPSMKPAGRNEVIQLKHTMEALLNRAGADLVEEKGPTQLHNLLEIIKQEQDIYNIIFHEIIRQVTVECKERGEVLSRLRERYANLLSRVPRQIKSLHEEVIAQRALDRRLTDELMHFKSTIAYLTEELTEVREHDKKISDQAHDTHKDLENALAEAQKNAALLTEYHDLYELQRKRLEKLVDTLTEEREVWCNASYSIAMKITEENKLNTSKRLNVAERSWSKLARHFAILLADQDTKTLSEIQKYAEEWREIIQEYRQDLLNKEDEARKHLQRIQSGLLQTRNILNGSSFDAEGKLLNVPDVRKCSSILNDFKYWLELLAKEIEKFTGDTVLISEESLRKTEVKLTKWTEMINKILVRHHNRNSTTNQQDNMNHEKLIKDIQSLHMQYKIRSHGDNGLAKALINFNNLLDLWYQKINSHVLSHQNEMNQKKMGVKMAEAEWIVFYQSIDELIDHARRASKFVSLSTPEIEEQSRGEELTSATSAVAKIASKPIDHDLLLNSIHEWLSSFSHYIESQDACIIDLVNTTHSSMIHWMVQILIRLAPDQESLSEEARQTIYISSASIEKLIENAYSLIDKVDSFTRSLLESCNPIVQDIMLENNNVDTAKKIDKEIQDMKSLQHECNEWVYSVKLLLAELTDDHSHIADLNRSQIRQSADVDDDEDIDGSKSHRQQQLVRNDTNRSDQTQILNINNKTSPDYSERKKKSPKNFGDDGHSYEIIAGDQNTERKPLQQVNLATTPESAVSMPIDNKEAIFSAYKTIERLQDQLINTEERAQHAETSVADLELKLKEALEKIRKIEKNFDFEDQKESTETAAAGKSESNQKLEAQENAVKDSRENAKIIRSTKNKALLKKQKK